LQPIDATIDERPGHLHDERAVRGSRRDSYVVPLLHTRVPGSLVTIGFFGALTATTLLGVVDPPMALLVGAAVVVAHHHRP